MKTVIINGQNHKGSTYNIGRLLAEKISCENEVKEFFLPKDLEHFCLGCYACVEDESKCPFYKEKSIIMNEVEKADLLIFTTPNYCMGPSAPMKAFIDLTFTYWFSHKPRECMFTKKAIVISTTAGIGSTEAIKPIARTLFYWGVPKVFKYGISVQAMNWQGVPEKIKKKITKDVDRLANKLSDTKKPYIPFTTKFMFNMMANMQKANLGSGATEKKYWQEHGWLGKERPWKQK